MWLAVDAAVPPEIPFETIGLVVVALITGICGVIVAVVQRGKRQANATPSGTMPEGVLTRTDPEWQKVRDTAILDRATIVMIEREVGGLTQEYGDHVEKASHRQGRAEAKLENVIEDMKELREDFKRFKESF